MHKNLVRIQEKVVEGAKENLRILEISDKRLLIIPVLACAERPLTEEEIVTRATMDVKAVHEGLAYLTRESFVITTPDDRTGHAVYEINPQLEKVVLRDVQTKAEAVRSNMKSHMAECESLLEAAKGEFDDYDRLMAKYLREKIGKIGLVLAVMTRRSSLLRLLESDGEGTEIKKISIE
jgi:hypothetical protein